MPEASDLLPPPSFPMRVRDINDLSPLHEQEERSAEMTVVDNKTEVGEDGMQKSTSKSSEAENDGTEETVEDDYGFFPMDDEEDFRGSKSGGQREDAASTSSGSSRGSLIGRRSSRQKPALKRGSAYGDSNEGIPLDFERKEFNRVLPKPDLSQRASVTSSYPAKEVYRPDNRSIFRVLSEPVFVSPVYQQGDGNDEIPTEVGEAGNSVSSGVFVEGAMKKRISFGTIKIREHAQTIGDNPSCSYGTPIQLDWEHEDLPQLKVDDYENYRPRPRTKEEFHMNHFQRANLLKLNGYSTNEIKDSKKQVNKMRGQREFTKFVVMNYPQLATVEAAIESGVRKVKRTISKSKSSTKSNAESITRQDSKDDLNLHSSGLSKSALLEMMDNDESNATAPF